MENKQDGLKYSVAFNYFLFFGPKKIKKIKAFFQNLENAWQAEIKYFSQAGIDDKTISAFALYRSKTDPDALMEDVAKKGLKIIRENEAEYPRLLKEIDSAPPLLYCRGDLKNLEPALAIVGTRKNSSYGESAAKKLAGELAENGLTIISGLAAGIDSCAHIGALKAGGRTIAVLGSGADCVFPSSGRRLGQEILDSGGALVSEFPPSAPIRKQNFVLRNRIISGLSAGVLVIEAGEKSGALITARYGLEQNREIFAVPGSIFSASSAGTNKLIKDGACLATAAADIILGLNMNIQEKKGKTEAGERAENEEEKAIISFLKNEPRHVDELARLTNLDTNIINSTLMLMEMKGFVKNIGGARYAAL